MIDKDGFRIGVGIIVCNIKNEILWAKRIRHPTIWQFPQGGIKAKEMPIVAVYRELYEEVGLCSNDVRLLGYTKDWLYYYLPIHMRRMHMRPLCIGQKQKWFLLQLINTADRIRLDSTHLPEFDDWRWVDYWYPVHEIVYFKRHIYRVALKELMHFLPKLPPC